MPNHAEALATIFTQHNADYPGAATIGPWQNFTRNLRVEQAMIVQIDTIPQLEALMKAIADQNMYILTQNSDDDTIKVRGAAGWRDDPTATTTCWTIVNKRWAAQQTKRYNQSYSITPGALANIVVTFSPRFQEENYLGNSSVEPTVVTVPAGMQVGDLAKRMHNSAIPTSLSTISMIWAVSVVGLFINCGHGAGDLEGSFAASVKAIHVIDHRGCYCIFEKGFVSECERNEVGEYVVVRKRPSDHFETMRASNLGLFGVVVKLVLNVKPEFMMREIRTTYYNLEAANNDIPLSERMKRPYFTVFWVPANNKFSPNIEFRDWSPTSGKDKIGHPAFDPKRPSRIQELQIRVNTLINDYIYEHDAEAVLPVLQKIGAKVAIGTEYHDKRNPDVRQGQEYEITHYQVGFPEDLMDISMLFAVDEAKLPEFFEALYNQIQLILNSPALKGKTPLTYGVYARIFQGLNGGMSTSATKPGQKILAFECVTHPDAPGLDIFLLALFTWVNENNYAKPRFHFGKFMPDVPFETFLGKPAVDEMRAALLDFYGSEEAVASSPFMTDYFKQKLQPGEGLSLPETLDGVRAALAPFKKATPTTRSVVTPVPELMERLITELSVGYGINLDIEDKQSLGITNTEVEVTPTCFDMIKRVFC